MVLSCDTSTDNNINTKDETFRLCENKPKPIENKDTIKYTGINCNQDFSDFSIYSVHYIGDWLQRLFVVSTVENIKDTVKLLDFVNSIEGTYNINSGTSISFFIDCESACYLDKYIEKNSKQNKDSIAEIWKEEMYIGEFDFDTKILDIFPAASTSSHR